MSSTTFDSIATAALSRLARFYADGWRRLVQMEAPGGARLYASHNRTVAAGLPRKAGSGPGMCFIVPSSTLFASATARGIRGMVEDTVRVM